MKRARAQSARASFASALASDARDSDSDALASAALAAAEATVPLVASLHAAKAESAEEAAAGLNNMIYYGKEMQTAHWGSLMRREV